MGILDVFFGGKEYLNKIKQIHDELSSEDFKKTVWSLHQDHVQRFRNLMKKLSVLETDLLANPENSENIKQIANLTMQYSKILEKEINKIRVHKGDANYSFDESKTINGLLDRLSDLLNAEIKINKKNKRKVFGLRAKLIGLVKERNISSPDLKKIMSAINILFDKQMHQVRKDGGIYVVHPLEVTINLLNTIKHNDPDLIIAAILHDIIEDTDVSEDYIRKQFGDRTLSIIKAMTNVKISTRDPEEERIAYQKHVLKQAESEDVFLLKLHDLENNVSSLKKLKDITTRRRLAKKYLPLIIVFSKKAIELSKKYWHVNRRFAEGLLAKARKYKRNIPIVEALARSQ